MTIEQMDKAMLTLSGCQGQLSHMITELTALQVEAKEYRWARNQMCIILRHLNKAFVDLGDLEDDFADEAKQLSEQN